MKICKLPTLWLLLLIFLRAGSVTASTLNDMTTGPVWKGCQKTKTAIIWASIVERKREKSKLCSRRAQQKSEIAQWWVKIESLRGFPYFAMTSKPETWNGLSPPTAQCFFACWGSEKRERHSGCTWGFVSFYGYFHSFFRHLKPNRRPSNRCDTRRGGACYHC